MAKKGTTRSLSDAHEEHLAAMLGGVVVTGSGNQLGKPMDGRHHDVPLGFAWDGKATQGKSLSISLATWFKAEEQSHESRPAMALRWCDPYEVPILDLMVLTLDDFVELRDLALKGLQAAEVEPCGYRDGECDRTPCGYRDGFCEFE